MKYFEVNYAADDASSQRELLANAWHLLHAIAKEKAVAFQVSFPYWKDPAKDESGVILRPGIFGPVMRVFADEVALPVFLAEVQAHRLVRSGEVTVSALRDVPASTEQMAFIRSRANDRVTDGYAQREERRLMRRANEGRLSLRAPDRARARQQQAVTHSNFVALRSKGNGKAFSLNVIRVTSDYWMRGINSYGLGGLVPVF